MLATVSAQPQCVREACREFTPDHVDPDCCGLMGQTFCAPGYSHHKVLSFNQGGDWQPLPGFKYDCPDVLQTRDHGGIVYGGNTCCTPLSNHTQRWALRAPDEPPEECQPRACSVSLFHTEVLEYTRSAVQDSDCCATAGGGACADGFVKSSLNETCDGVQGTELYCCTHRPSGPSRPAISDGAGGALKQRGEGEDEDTLKGAACPAETLDLLDRGVSAGLCGYDYCSPDIVFAICRDWSACAAALRVHYPAKVGERAEQACYAGIGLAGILLLVLVHCLCCACCLGAVCVREQRRKVANAEERAGLTRNAEDGSSTSSSTSSTSHAGRAAAHDLARHPMAVPAMSSAAAAADVQMVGGVAVPGGHLAPSANAEGRVLFTSARKAEEDPLARIEKLKALLDAGAIHEGEYHGMKAEMLSRV